MSEPWPEMVTEHAATVVDDFLTHDLHAECACGWVGPQATTTHEALADHAAHVQATPTTSKTPPLDLDAVRTHSSRDVPALITEVTRLRQHEKIRAKVIADHQSRLIAADGALAEVDRLRQELAEARTSASRRDDVLAARLERAKRVVETAKTVVAELKRRGYRAENQWFIPETGPFVAAVDAYQATPTTSEPTP